MFMRIFCVSLVELGAEQALSGIQFSLLELMVRLVYLSRMQE